VLLEIFSDYSGVLRNSTGSISYSFPAGYFTEGQWYTLRRTCDVNNNISAYLNGSLIQQWQSVYTGNSSGSFGINVDNGTIRNLSYSGNVTNVAPVVGTITAPSMQLVNTSLTASASFTDADTSNTHMASWNWGDGNTSTGTVTESSGSGSVSDTHTYIATGVYTITLTVTDNGGLSGTSTYNYVAVYASNSSFSGGNKYANPSTASPSTSGDVKFGISSKYDNNNNLVGNVKMNFKNANIAFASTALSSLTTSSGKAYLTGSGTYNGTSGYTFLATGIDGTVAGGSDRIRFRIKDGSGNVVYDSQPGAGDTDDPTTTVSTGNVRVH
jgi:PKD repeat protein